MSLQLSKNEKKILLFVVGIVILLMTLFYFNYLSPLRADVQLKEQRLEQNKQVYATILEQKGQLQHSIEEDTELLQKRLPVQPLIDHFILELEKAELLSNSLVSQMSFSGTSGGVEQTMEEIIQERSQPIGENSGEATSQNVVEQPLSTPVSKIPVSLSVQSPTYYDLEKFLDTLENLDRIVTVESVGFSGKPEGGGAAENIGYQVSLSLYYLPSLADLQNELPKLETGEPANKSNPLD
jgi:type IV pilus assembly protein PilO